MNDDKKNKETKHIPEEDTMSKLSNYIKNNKESVYSFARKNTPVNNEGRAVITKNDEWRTEVDWDKNIQRNGR